MRTRTKLASLALAVSAVAIGGAIYVAGAGGQAATTPQLQTIQNSGRDLSTKSCAEPFQGYDLGQRFQGYALQHAEATCSAPERTTSQLAGGQVDPDSVQRVHYRTSIYGTCQATNDSGCAPPLEVQVWPACERSAADYNSGEPENVSTIKPSELVDVRGVPGRFYGPDRLEVSTGDVTVVIFGNSRDLILKAAQQLRSQPGTGTDVSADQALAAPVRGAQEGTLPC